MCERGCAAKYKVEKITQKHDDEKKVYDAVKESIEKKEKAAKTLKGGDLTKANGEIATLKKKESKALTRRKTLFKSLKKAKNDFTRIKGKCPSTKSVTTAKDCKKKASEQIVSINKKIAEAKASKKKTGDKTEAANLTVTIKNLRKER